MGTPAFMKKTYRKPSYQKQVEGILGRYRLVKQMMESGLYRDFPSLTPVYEERIGHGKSEYQSTTEEYGINRAEDSQLIRLVESGLALLTPSQRRIITERYLADPETTDYLVYYALKMSRRNYYRLKRRAIRTLAIVFGCVN